MMAGTGRMIALAGTGLVIGLAIVATFFGGGDLLKRFRGATPPAQNSRAAADLPRDGADAPPAPKTNGDQAAIGSGENALAGAGGRSQAQTQQDADKTPELDILRVEPSGETVLAGRGAPKAAIELMRDNKTVARVTADESGQFAIDGLSLPPGNSELTLRSTTPDGKTTEGKASAVVVVDKDRKAQPLVAVSETDKPTRVLSMPNPVAEGGKPPTDSASAPPKQATASSGTAGAPGSAQTAPLRIVSVDAQEGGRLHVSGQGAAWTSLRLYLNDTMVASGKAGADGRIAFTIGRGVKPGGYQVRIDQVEPDSGKVLGRAQVGFNFPVQLAAKEPVNTAAKDKPSIPAKKAEVPATSGERPVSPQPPAKMVETKRPDASSPSSTPPKAAADKRNAAEMAAAKPNATVPGEPAPAPTDQAAAVFVPEIDTAKIIRGDNLWQISRKSYGDGKRYTVIYEANRDQIRNPNLIYPGQIFVMPKDTPAADRQGAKRG